MLFRLFSFFLLSLISISIVNSHLGAGEDKVIGDYLVDFGYEPEILEEDEEATIALNLVNATSNELIVPESVWVRISNENKIVFAGTFSPEAMHVGFAFIFPEKGNYEIKSEFRGEDKVIVSTTFLVEVGEKSSEDPRNKMLYFLGALIVVIISIIFFTLIGLPMLLNRGNRKK